jgi:hypothetical protein
MPEHVYHYTSLDALVGILKKEVTNDSSGNTKTLSSLTFWGSRYDCMNDPQDYIFASKVVLPKVIKSLEQRDDINDDLKENDEMFPYIVSFTENRDDELMWKHYNADVCLEIDTNYLSPWIQDKEWIKGFWGKCIYAKEQDIDDKFIKAWRNSFQYIENIPSMARHACVFIKRKAFEPENEWRLYIADENSSYIRTNGDIDNFEHPKDVKVKVVRDKDIVLYKEFRIDAKALKGIIINDTDFEHFQRVKKHLEVLLISRGFYPKAIQIEQTNRYPL